MFKFLMDWFFSSQAAKTAGAAAGGSVVSITMLMGVLDAKVEKSLELAHRETVNYVDRKHDVLASEIGLVRLELVYVRNGQLDINSTLRVMSNRIYNLNKEDK